MWKNAIVEVGRKKTSTFARSKVVNERMEQEHWKETQLAWKSWNPCDQKNNKQYLWFLVNEIWNQTKLLNKTILVRKSLTMQKDKRKRAILNLNETRLAKGNIVSEKRPGIRDVRK